MFGIRKQLSGRVLMLRCEGPLNGEDLSPDQVMSTIRSRRVRFLVLDATRAPFIDSNGLRWLQRLKDKLSDTETTLRIAARPQGKVSRTLRLLNLDRDMYDSLSRAWKAPWREYRAA